MRGCTDLQELRLGTNYYTPAGTLTLTSQSTKSNPVPNSNPDQELRLGTNYLKGTLEPLRNCTALLGLGLAGNHFSGSLEPLQDCKALLGLDCRGND
jgi:hypothetical protein